MTSSDLEQDRLAITYLLKGLELTERYRRERNNHVILEEHPFGLNTRVRDDFFENKVYLIADPRNTEPSEQGMIFMLQHEFSEYTLGKPNTFRLRIIRVQGERNWNEPTRFIHDLYFELITKVGSFICGGCADFPGTGGNGGDRLEIIFKHFGAVYGVPVEEFVIPSDQIKRFRRLLSDAYNKRHERKEAV